jgi:hypothetical protein
MARAGHVLHDRVRIAGDMLSDVRRNHARVDIENVAGLAPGNDRNRFALIVRRLRPSAGEKSKQDYKYKKRCS